MRVLLTTIPFSENLTYEVFILSALKPKGSKAVNMNNLNGLLSSLGGLVPETSKGICFQGMQFSEPALFCFSYPPSEPGIYAILTSDPAWKPRPYRVVYFGKAADLATRISYSHEKHTEWSRAAGGSAKLLVAYYAMPESSDMVRASAERNLIRRYRPECNQQHNHLRSLLGY